MTTYLIVLGFLVGFMVFLERSQKSIKLPILKRFRKALYLVFIGVIPLAYVQFSLPDIPENKGDYYLRLGEHNEDDIYRIKGYKYKCIEDPSFSNFLALFELNGEHYFDYGLSLEEVLEKSEIDGHELLVVMSLHSVVAESKPLDLESLALLDESAPGTNFVLSRQAILKGYYNEAIDYTINETEHEELRSEAYNQLQFLYHPYPDSLEALYLNWESAKYLPSRDKRTFFFEHGYMGHYFKHLYYDAYEDTTALALIIALIVCAIWLLYIRSLDIFAPEKWLNILLVFACSWLLTEVCLLGYDFAHLSLDFYPDGTWQTDFLYCVFVIGGSEEIVKALPWLAFVLIFRKSREPYDYIVYSCAAALGFAGAENVMYFENYNFIVIGTRFIMSTVGHMFFASLVAYGYILMKYRYKDKKWAPLLPVVGFAAALLAHGFYDFWLLSPSVEGLWFFTYIFFVASLHIWFTFKNNALNNSQYYSGKVVLKRTYSSFIILAGFITALMIEYVVTSTNFGTLSGDSILSRSSVFLGFFGMYLISTFESFTLKQGVWGKINFRLTRRFSSLFKLSQIEGKSRIGEAYRLFTSKSNPYVGSQFPVSGVIIKDDIIMNDNNQWCLLDLNSSIFLNGKTIFKVLIRPNIPSVSLDTDKLEILCLLIDDENRIHSNDKLIEEFRYIGKVYSRPITN